MNICRQDLENNLKQKCYSEADMLVFKFYGFSLLNHVVVVCKVGVKINRWVQLEAELPQQPSDNEAGLGGARWASQRSAVSFRSVSLAQLGADFSSNSVSGMRWFQVSIVGIPFYLSLPLHSALPHLWCQWGPIKWWAFTSIQQQENNENLPFALLSPLFWKAQCETKLIPQPVYNEKCKLVPHFLWEDVSRAQGEMNFHIYLQWGSVMWYSVFIGVCGGNVGK